MDYVKDYYVVLGILPDAEDVVVIAAYRALASLYHPDRWKGDAADATRRMAEINVAYGVLGNPDRRKEYDASRKYVHGTFESNDDEKDAAFDAALNQLERRWQIAVDVFPDLVDIRRNLAKTAHRLAFAFVTVMLETKQFPSRRLVADALEKKFLELHFGTDANIVAFAKQLIGLGLKDAIVALNRYVDVLGPGIDSQVVIAKVQADFKVLDARDLSIIAARKKAKTATLKWKVKQFRKVGDAGYLSWLITESGNTVRDAQELASLSGYDVSIIGTGLFKPENYEIRIRGASEPIAKLTSAESFLEWVMKTLCS